MLLGLMRRQAKSWLIKFLIGIIALVFVFYFGYSFSSRRGVKIAYVNGEMISGLEYQKEYRDLLESFRKQYKGFWNDSLIKTLNLKNRALDNLIDQKLISQEARRLGMDVTESEIQDAIMDYPAFQIDGQFDIRRYRALLSNNRMKAEDFESAIGRELLEKKLKEFLLAFMEVTDQEVRDQYTFTNKKTKISFMEFSPDKFRESVKVDQPGMQGFFKEHKEDYRVPEKIKVAYIVIDPAAFRDQIKVTDPEIKDYYENHQGAFSEPKQVRARHILFKLNRDATKEEVKKVRERAEKVLKEARQGKDFAALARKYSEGPTKTKGGDLGYFPKGRMVKPFEDVAFKLKRGEVSNLVRTRFGYHIIKVEDIRPARTKTLDEVRDKIVDTLMTSATMDLAYEKGLSLIDQMPYDVDLAQYAAGHDLKTNQTGYFSQHEAIPGVGGAETLRKSLFSLEKEEASDLVEVNKKYYIFQVTDKKGSYLPEMEEVADKVKKDFAEYLAAKKARAVAETCLSELQKGKSWDELAKERHLRPEETDFFTHRDPIQKIGNEPELKEMAFGLSKAKRYPDKIFENDRGAFIIRWEADKDIDQKKYEEEKEKYRFSLMQRKQMRAFENWLEGLKRNAEIKVVTPVAGV